MPRTARIRRPLQSYGSESSIFSFLRCKLLSLYYLDIPTDDRFSVTSISMPPTLSLRPQGLDLGNSYHCIAATLLSITPLFGLNVERQSVSWKKT